MSRQLLRRLTLFISALIAVVAVPLAANLFSLESADRAAAVVGALAALTALLVSVYGFLVSSRGLSSAQSEEQKSLAAMDLIKILGSIEEASFLVFGEREEQLGMAARRLPLRGIRDQMMSLGIWADEDVVGFDELVHTRNRVVHGDFDSVSMKDLAEATSKARQLRNKIPIPMNFDESV